MPKYPVLEPLEHDQKPYVPGSAVELTEEQAAPLLAVKVIGEPVADSTPARPNVAETIKLVEAAENLEELDKLAAGEDRKTVLEAIEKRRAALSEAK
jgi:hypothetical protein